MIIKALMLAFSDGRTREINIPDEEVKAGDDYGLLEKAFYYGQNDFQPVENCPSVSVGDVIELPDGLFIVRAWGFGRISPKDLEEYKSLDRRTRGISPLLD